MRRFALALAATLPAALAATNPAAACLGPAAPYLEHLVASGIATETLDGAPMASVLALLHERVDFDEAPTRINS